MYKSWGKLKNRLEKDLLCDSLKSRVQYFYTVYRKSHDGVEDRFAILVDKIEVFKANSFECGKYHYFKKDLRETLDISWVEARRFADDVKFKNFDYCSCDVFHSIRQYISDPILKSINTDDYIVKMFAILDRRVGKRILSKLRNELQDLPEWLKYFYKLRLDAENILYDQVHETII